MTSSRSPRIHERWARLRFSVIGQLLAAPPAKGELRAAIAALAARQWCHPDTGEAVSFGFSTIQRWFYIALRERNDPVGKLRRKRRADAGRERVMSDAVRQAALSQYAAHKSWSARLHHDNLVALSETRPELRPVPSYSTLRRFLKSQGLDKRRRMTPRRTTGAERAEARLSEREVRGYEAEYVGSLLHWDCHVGSKKVLTPRGEWQAPVLFGVIDDRSRLVCHLQWYLTENAENIAHGLSQAFQRRGLPRAAQSDNGAAMTAVEIDEGLNRLGVLHERTLPYTPAANGKIESLWGVVEGRLLAMLEDVPDLTLAFLNEATQAWVERDYNRRVHSETNQTPVARFLAGPDVIRPCPDSAALKLAFTKSDRRSQRRSDGTITVEGNRFEVPSRYRHFTRLEIRYASWDLTHVYLVDEHTGQLLCRLFPQDKVRNAGGLRRPLEQISPQIPHQPVAIPPASGIAPLLARLIQQQADSGLPPPYLPKDEQGDDK